MRIRPFLHLRDSGRTQAKLPGNNGKILRSQPVRKWRVNLAKLPVWNRIRALSGIGSGRSGEARLPPSLLPNWYNEVPAAMKRPVVQLTFGSG